MTSRSGRELIHLNANRVAGPTLAMSARLVSVQKLLLGHLRMRPPSQSTSAFPPNNNVYILPLSLANLKNMN